MPIPKIDERIKYVGPTFLRQLNGQTLREVEGPVVIQVDEEPVVVMVPWEQYLRMQKAWKEK